MLEDTPRAQYILSQPDEPRGWVDMLAFSHLPTPTCISMTSIQCTFGKRKGWGSGWGALLEGKEGGGVGGMH